MYQQVDGQAVGTGQPLAGSEVVQCIQTGHYENNGNQRVIATVAGTYDLTTEQSAEQDREKHIQHENQPRGQPG